ncbi:AfsR/SARP family transcriptional regulator [Virgisporangium aurantiacum]|uniref:Bacterial transcriptional activator domain-containing protein n=1 Tax=Virgisporangium aurantiacum TaxID=175570 RepID=A0A8J3ZDN5_9ACTN|nr:AfsR/SARP family transcriptional regulator [Virgisporangium aurantiacum]GIJ62011.1 hypothetical protein Vau01_095270 [Virgisporangium aurantiacum]
MLVVDPEAVDLHQLVRLAGQARTARSDAVALRLWEQALALWRGEAFAGLDSEWLAAVRTDLDQRRWAAMLDRNDLALRQGRHGALLAELTAAAAACPLDERLAEQLMLALYRCGRQGEALTHFDRTRRLLVEDLGIDPSPPLRDVHRQILTNDPALHAPAAVDTVETSAPGDEPADPSRVAAGRCPTQLPADVSAFTGRVEELSHLDALLHAARSREHRDSAEAAAVVISAVSGTAGVGKTGLAVRWRTGSGTCSQTGSCT